MNPSEYAGIIRAASHADLVDLNVSIPARITAVSGNKVNVVPSIKKTRMLKDGSKVFEETGEIEGIPVMNIGCSGFSINIPLSIGCEGLLIFCDYDIDAWLQGIQEPHTSRYHDQNDAFFLPMGNIGNNEGDVLEIRSSNVSLKIGGSGFDVNIDGESLMDIVGRPDLKP